MVCGSTRPRRDGRPEAPALDDVGDRDAEQIEDARHDVDMLREVVHGASRSDLTRQLHDQRHGDLLLIERVAVSPPAVVVKGFTVVGHDEDQCLVVEVVVPQPLHQLAKVMVVVGDLGVVQRRELGADRRNLVRRQPGA